MPALTTFLELQDQVMLLAGMSGTADRDLVKDCLNIALNDWWSRYSWRYKRAEGWATTKAPYSTGTIEATAGTQITLTGGTWPSDAAGMKIAVPGVSGPWYRIETRDSDTVVTVDRTIPNHATLIPSGTAFYLYSNELDLSAITDMEVLLTNHVMLHDSTNQGRRMIYMPEVDVAEKGFPRGTGTPRAFSEAYPDLDVDDGLRRLWVGPLAPDGVYQIHFFYERLPTALTSDSQKPEIPQHHRQALVHGALREVYRQDEFRDTALAQQAEQKFEFELSKAWKQHKRSRPRVQFVRPFDHAGRHSRLHFTVTTP